MSFEIQQALRYMFNAYNLAFTILACMYGLIIDLKLFNKEGLDREKKIAKGMYIGGIIIGIIIFAIPRIF
ncbi:hypothetical protein Curi_c01520 [Gottschalkia acidurici 9a]|uniref:Uncharacterized protein n=1 Tax=Gottschalkia acidurici (strain ATCC 7906 / DSM 604 / BCRC 14475 / CIP 104303 / KCTC 5404 / NCIMB 10678 / 9a) TaxID=1128398 RepID=K0AWS8_GOTA9|nr:CLC_0170 family protein [Gottschalkia acidurici]AFS77232.1 hypothetical protein Curi_c01520 [Gottschalkia acidurici 9a]